MGKYLIETGKRCKGSRMKVNSGGVQVCPHCRGRFKARVMGTERTHYSIPRHIERKGKNA